jgi:hypothetical protein
MQSIGKPAQRGANVAVGYPDASARRTILRARLLLPLIVGAVAAALVGSVAAESAPAEVRFRAERVVVLGDIHGAYDRMLDLLRATGVVDKDLHWAAGSTHLVSLGDILDRGAGARSALDLLMRLQDEAAAAGGRVHVVLGNHELMNLIGDLRYVPDAEFATFAAESPAAPKPGEHESAAIAGTHTADATVPGYAARYDAFRPDGVYGRWLLEQPTALIVNDTAFVHGGLPPVAATLGPAELDGTVKARLRELLQLRTELASAGVIEQRSDIPEAAAALKAARMPSATTEGSARPAPSSPPPLTPGLEVKVARFVELAEDDLFGDGGTMWYRGTALCHDVLERPVLEAGLANWGARRVVVGHTPTWDSRVRARFEGRAILADTGMLYEYYRGRPAALLIDGEDLRVRYADEPDATTAPDPRAGLEFDTLDLGTVERVLAGGSIAALQEEAAGATAAELDALESPTARPPEDLRATLPAGTQLVTVTDGADTVTALFEPGSRNGIGRELAAYRLDRLLGLGLVAPAAEREFDGKRGVVSARWSRTVDEQARAAANRGRSNWCARGSDYQLMYVFDALIDNRGRTANSMLYDRRTWQFASAGHAQAFGRGRELPPYLASAPKVVPPALADALRRLDEPSLQSAVGAWLGKAQIRALLQRRDDLLDTWTTSEASR